MRLLFVSMPIHSHLTPMLPLATSAVAAGHTGACATGPDALVRVDKPGITGVPAGLPRDEVARRYRRRYPAVELAGLPPRRRADHRQIHAIIGISAPAMAADLVPFARDFRPDVVVNNLVAYAGRVAA